MTTQPLATVTIERLGSLQIQALQKLSAQPNGIDLEVLAIVLNRNLFDVTRVGLRLIGRGLAMTNEYGFLVITDTGRSALRGVKRS